MKNSVSSLKIYLLQSGISQSEISRNTGLSRSTITNLVNRNKASKSVRVLIKLYLGLDDLTFKSLCDTPCKVIE